ncbi:MAG: 16S rRNA (cytosine(1402)-N(4))-methyltransferase RsmH [Nitratireductor sp.]
MSLNANDGVAAGGPLPHIPVMLNEVLKTLSPTSGEVHLDGTFGAGGYTKAIMGLGANVIALDRDPDAVANGQDLVAASNGALNLVQDRFSNLGDVAADLDVQLDGVVLDIGVSSMQLDQSGRGFSFQKDGPLDMRMAQSGVSAADVVNNADQQPLTRVIGILGEEKKASRISRAIIDARKSGTFTSTLQLANLIEKTIGRRPTDKIHPATRSFQALRIFVNQELEELCHALLGAERALKPGGRLVVVTFHSLEDRIVKRFFSSRTGGSSGSRHLPEITIEAPTFHQTKRGALSATKEECEINPRSRSAKLRFGTRLDIEARKPDLSIFGLPNLKLLES